MCKALGWVSRVPKPTIPALKEFKVATGLYVYPDKFYTKSSVLWTKQRFTVFGNI